MLRVTVLSCIVLIAGAIPAYGQGRDSGRLFEAADENKDGIVTREEFRASRAKSFSRLDRNNDGYIDDKDLPKRRRARTEMASRMAELRNQFDANRDGRISEAEFASGPTLMFDRADADGNGQLDASEIAAAKEAVEARRKR